MSTTLSRFQEGRIRDVPYVANYWKEHKENFTQFVQVLLQIDTIVKLVRNAKEISLKFVIQWRMCPPEFAENIALAFDKLANSIAETKNKDHVLNLITNYFEIVALSSHDSDGNPRSLDVRDIHTCFDVTDSNWKKLEPLVKDLAECFREVKDFVVYFLPPLFLFIVRFFDIYDAATKGCTVSQVMKVVETQQKEEHVKQVTSSPDKLKNVWEQAGSGYFGPSEKFHYDPHNGASNPQIEEQIQTLHEACESARLDIQALYNHKGKEFIEKWKSLSEEEQKNFVKICREEVSNRAEFGIMYCPELNDNDLCKENGDMLVKLLQQCVGYTDDISTLDAFVSKLHYQMKQKNMPGRDKSVVTVIYSRRWVFCTFCVAMIMHVLGLGEEKNSTPSEQSPKESIIDALADMSLKNVVKDTKIPQRDKSNPLERVNKQNPEKPYTGLKKGFFK